MVGWLSAYLPKGVEMGCRYLIIPERQGRILPDSRPCCNQEIPGAL